MGITKNPSLMVIGDSLAQGCRSLTVSKRFCEQSTGAVISRSQGFDFITPDFPRPVLFDVEEEVRRIDFGLGGLAVPVTLDGFISRLRQNLKEWLVDNVESKQVCFDNLGLTGCLVGDLFRRSSKSSEADIQRLTKGTSEGPISDLSIGDLHLAINARFTLNPSHSSDFADFTPIRWVQERKPKTLVVQAGHNHGLYSVGGDAMDASVTQKNFWEDWQELSGLLAGLSSDTTKIVILLLPKVGAVANLESRSVARQDGYAEFYEPLLSVSPNLLEGARLHEIDNEIAEINERIKKTILDTAQKTGSQGRVAFLDTFALIEGYDYKNSLKESKRIKIGPFTIDNRVLDGIHIQDKPRAGWGRPLARGSKLVGGGFQSMDGMHPSGAGYAVIASHLMDALGMAHDRAKLLQNAYLADSLIADFPMEFEGLLGLLSIVRASRQRNYHFAKEGVIIEGHQDPPLDVCLNLMKQATVPK